MKISASIIAGGQSYRLNGIKKESIIINDKSILQRQISVIKPIFEDYFTIAKNSISDDIKNYQDTFSNVGPLAGIHAALTNSINNYVFCFSCDLPFISQLLILQMIEQAEKSRFQAIIPRHNDKIEPLLAIYHKSIIPIIEQQIKSNDFKIRNIFDKIIVNYFDISNEFDPAIIFFNINYPNDIIKAQEYAQRIDNI